MYFVWFENLYIFLWQTVDVSYVVEYEKMYEKFHKSDQDFRVKTNYIYNVFYFISFHFKNKVRKIIKELFEAATMEAPPKGIAHCKMVSCKNRYKNLIINPYFKINAIESSVG
jgi:hypothetical protein